MEHSENVDVAVRFDEVSYSVVAVEKDSDETRRLGFVTVAGFGILLQ
jgi:hypothetical protein